MKAEYIVPSIIIMDYELYLQDTTFTRRDTDGQEVQSKYRGDGTIPIVSMDDDEW